MLYSYNQHYRAYLKGGKQGPWYYYRPSGETIKRDPIFLKEIKIWKKDAIVSPLGSFSLITKRQGWRTSVVYDINLYK